MSFHESSCDHEHPNERLLIAPVFERSISRGAGLSWQRDEKKNDCLVSLGQFTLPASSKLVYLTCFSRNRFLCLH